MDNSLKTGQYMVEVLNDNQELISILGEGKIFPLVAKNDTLYPFVIYERVEVSTVYTKEIGHDNTVQINFRVYSDQYDQSLDIANMIRNILERKTINFPDNIKINDIRLLATYEQFSEDGYVETLAFTTQVE